MIRSSSYIEKWIAFESKSEKSGYSLICTKMFGWYFDLDIKQEELALVREYGAKQTFL